MYLKITVWIAIYKVKMDASRNKTSPTPNKASDTLQTERDRYIIRSLKTSINATYETYVHR